MKLTSQQIATIEQREREQKTYLQNLGMTKQNLPKGWQQFDFEVDGDYLRNREHKLSVDKNTLNTFFTRFA